MEILLKVVRLFAANKMLGDASSKVSRQNNWKGDTDTDYSQAQPFTSTQLTQKIYLVKPFKLVKVESYKVQNESDHTFLTLHIFHHFMCDKRLMSVDV